MLLLMLMLLLLVSFPVHLGQLLEISFFFFALSLHLFLLPLAQIRKLSQQDNWDQWRPKPIGQGQPKVP
jgi:hypothetical protein